MQLILPRGKDKPSQLLLDNGPVAGQKIPVNPRVCANPCCDCSVVALLLQLDELTPQDQSPRAPISLDFNFDTRQVKLSPTVCQDSRAEALVASIKDEISESHWLDLERFYVALKRHYTKHADFDEVHAKFPAQVAEGSSAAFYAVLPFAEPVELRVQGRDWLLDDQYCVQPRCTCTNGVLSFYELIPVSDFKSETHPEPGCVARFHYVTGQVELMPPSTDPTLQFEDFLVALKSAHPDLTGFFRQRHDLLRRLYRQFLDRKQTRRAAPKTGRNAPCPCGSGKKFKHCCGAN